MIRDRELHKVTGDSFVPKNRPRIFDLGTQVKILRLRIVGGNKKEPDRVLIVNPRWIHEAARARRLERLWQLPNLKLPEVIRQGDKLMRFQKIDHLGLAAFIRLQECLLIGRNTFRAGRVGIGHGWVREKSLDRKSTR